MADEENREWKKIVERVPVNRTNQEPSLIGIVDVIQVHLGIRTNDSTVSDRLSKVATQIEQKGGVVDDVSYRTILDAVDRLKKIEQFLADEGL